MNWKRWPWLNDGVLPLAMIILRVCWLWLWLGLARRLLTPSYQGLLLPAWLIGGLLLASLVTTRWIVGRTGSLTRARLGIAGLGLVVMFLVFWWQFYRLHYSLWDWRWLNLWGHEMLFWSGEPPPSYLALPAVVYLWLRGIVDGSRPLERDHVVRAFAAGCLALVIFLLVAGSYEPGLPAGAGNVVFLFFATAMVALALSSLRTARVYEPGQGGPVSLNRYWLGSVLAVILGLLALGLLLSLLVSPRMVAQMLEWTWGVFSQALILLIQIVSLILSPILYLLARLLPSLFRRLDLTPLPELAPPDGEERNPLDRLAPIVERLPEEWRWVGLFLFILGIGLLFALVLRRLVAKEKEEIEETRELIFSRDLLLAQLAQLWPDWLKQLRRQPPALLSPFLSLAGEFHTRRIIREVYQALLAAARQQEHPRRPDQTPVEYGRELAQLFPDNQATLNLITNSYIQARYDSERPAPAQAERTRQAWQQLQARWTRFT